MKDLFRDIRPYRVGAILWITDFLVLFPLLNGWAKKRAKSLTLDYLGDRSLIEADLKKGAFFMTNHRDIVMDAAWLSYLLRKRYFIRPFMGVGNNLFAKPWIKFVMRYLRCLPSNAEPASMRSWRTPSSSAPISACCASRANRYG